MSVLGFAFGITITIMLFLMGGLMFQFIDLSTKPLQSFVAIVAAISFMYVGGQILITSWKIYCGVE